jgi:hypothetical protein
MHGASPTGVSPAKLALDAMSFLRLCGTVGLRFGACYVIIVNSFLAALTPPQHGGRFGVHLPRNPRIAGVDLTDILGVSAIAAQVVLTESGPMSVDSAMPPLLPPGLGTVRTNESEVVKCSPPKARKVKNRVAIVLRLGAKSLSVPRTASARFSAECEPGLALRRPLQQRRISSHASSTTSYTAKNPTQRQSFTAAMNKNSNEPKCAFANTPHNSASNSYPSQQIQQLSKLVPEEESRLR